MDALTFTVTVHDALAASVPPVKPMLAPPAAPPVTLPPQVLVTVGEPVLTRPAGYGSSNASAAIGLSFGFAIVIESVVAKVMFTGFGLKVLAIDGAAIPVTVSVAADDAPAPAFVVETAPLLLT